MSSGDHLASEATRPSTSRHSPTSSASAADRVAKVRTREAEGRAKVEVEAHQAAVAAVAVAVAVAVDRGAAARQVSADACLADGHMLAVATSLAEMEGVHMPVMAGHLVRVAGRQARQFQDGRSPGCRQTQAEVALDHQAEWDSQAQSQ